MGERIELICKDLTPSLAIPVSRRQSRRPNWINTKGERRMMTDYIAPILATDQFHIGPLLDQPSGSLWQISRTILTKTNVCMIGVSDCVAPVNSLCAQNIFFPVESGSHRSGCFCSFRCMGAFGQYVGRLRSGKVLGTLQGVSIGPLDTEHLLPVEATFHLI